MAIYSYDQVRFVLRRIGSEKRRNKKHETWEKVSRAALYFKYV